MPPTKKLAPNTSAPSLMIGMLIEGASGSAGRPRAGSMIKGGAGGTDERRCDVDLVSTSNALMDMHLERPETLRVMSDSAQKPGAKKTLARPVVHLTSQNRAGGCS